MNASLPAEIRAVLDAQDITADALVAIGEAAHYVGLSLAYRIFDERAR